MQLSRNTLASGLVSVLAVPSRVREQRRDSGPRQKPPAEACTRRRRRSAQKLDVKRQAARLGGVQFNTCSACGKPNKSNKHSEIAPSSANCVVAKIKKHALPPTQWGRRRSGPQLNRRPSGYAFGSCPKGAVRPRPLTSPGRRHRTTLACPQKRLEPCANAIGTLARVRSSVGADALPRGMSPAAKQKPRGFGKRLQAA